MSGYPPPPPSTTFPPTPNTSPPPPTPFPPSPTHFPSPSPNSISCQLFVAFHTAWNEYEMRVTEGPH